MDADAEKDIVNSWCRNVRPWVRAIQNDEIASRVKVTNGAILKAIESHHPSTLLDVGCGEGWLLREASKLGIACTGMDVVPEFGDHVEASGATFCQLAYEDLGPQAFDQKFDAVVCNFSLLGKESVENVIQRSADVLKPDGVLIVQTLHPQELSTPETYTDGWREGSWQGFSEDFVDPAPWYFRTLESWLALFERAGYRDVELTEPCDPESGQRLSVIFEARLPQPGVDPD